MVLLRMTEANTPTALWLSQPLAEQGNVTAQIVLGSMYYAGIGHIKDDRKALRWYLGWRLNKETQMRSLISVTCTQTGKALRKMIAKQ